MFQIIRKKQQQFGSGQFAVDAFAAYDYVAQLSIGKRNNGVRSAGYFDSFIQVDSLAVAAAGSSTVLSPGAGNIIQAGYLQFWTSVAGAFQVILGGINLFNEVTVINTPVRYSFAWPGFFMYPSAGILTIKNNTAGASDIHSSLVYSLMLA